MKKGKTITRIWVTESGHRLKIKEMSKQHILNTIQMLKRNSKKLNREMQRYYERGIVDLSDYPGSLPERSTAEWFPDYKFLIAELKDRRE
jgi:hypothetical protein